MGGGAIYVGAGEGGLLVLFSAWLVRVMLDWDGGPGLRDIGF